MSIETDNGENPTAPRKSEAEKPAEAKKGFREEGIDGVWEHTPPKKRGFHESF